MKFYRAYSFKQFYLAVTSLSRLENTAQRKKESMMMLMLNFVMLVLSLSRFSTRDVRTFIVCIRTVAVSLFDILTYVYRVILLARLHASSASRIMISLYESEDCINYKTHSERRWHTCDFYLQPAVANRQSRTSHKLRVSPKFRAL